MTETTAAAARRSKTRLLGVLPAKWVCGFIDSLAAVSNVLVRLNVSPNFITLLALVAGLAAGVLFAFNHPGWAGVLIFVCGALDVIDGKVAAKAKKQSLYGAIFDSTLDRYAEFFIYFGLAYYFRGRWPMWIPYFTLLGSVMVSYTRARAEGLGVECRVGFMQRAERLILLVLGTLIGTIFKVFDPAMITVLVAIAVVSNITAIERTLHVRKIERQTKKDKEV
jgi:CDP-diacylglycerol--glycerol-3-phosphate 3-phosphatidyltransferase